MCLRRSAQTKYAHVCAEVGADVCADVLTETKNLNYLNQMSEIILHNLILSARIHGKHQNFELFVKS